MLKKISLYVGIVILLILGYLTYAGIFNKAIAVEGEEGGYKLIGIDHKGAYKNIGKTFKNFRDAVEKVGLKNQKFAGVYFDDPKTVKEENLRSFAAVIIQNEEDAKKLLQIEGAHTFDIEKGHAVICDMKSNNIVSMIIAISKAYPALGEYAEKHPFKTAPKHFYELYKDDTIRFVMQF